MSAMNTNIRWTIFLMTILGGCGQVGLDSLSYVPDSSDGVLDNDDDSQLDDDDVSVDTGYVPDTDADENSDEDDDQDYELEGDTGTDEPAVALLEPTTYAVMFSDIVFESAPSVALQFDEMQSDRFLFYVEEESDDQLRMVMAMADADGEQNACQPMFDLPRADWDDSLGFSVDNADVVMPLVGKPVHFDAMGLEGQISNDGELWEWASLTAIVDVRDLQNGLVAPEIMLCDELEASDKGCQPCSDGLPFCAQLEFSFDAFQVEIAFDPDLQVADDC